MRFAAALLITLILSGTGVLGQDTPARKFIGTWEARFNGAVFCILKIQDGDKLAGTMSSMDISVDEDGNLRSAEGKDAEYPMLHPSIENDALAFEWTDDPDQEPIKLELKLTGKQEAVLRFVTAPEGVAIKPFTFTRRASSGLKASTVRHSLQWFLQR